MKLDEMNDLQAIDNYIDECRHFVNPRLLHDISKRGLYHVINFLPSNISEAKSVARARLAAMGKSFGDEETDNIANTVMTVERLLKELSALKATDVHKTIPVLESMLYHSKSIRDYLK